MKFHHLGIATKDIEKTLQWIKKTYNIKNISDKIFDPIQNAHLVYIETNDIDIELVSGKVVEKLIKKSITYYHICYEVDNMQKAIDSFNNSILISKPKEAILFDNRKIAFLMTPMGLVELLERR